MADESIEIKCSEDFNGLDPERDYIGQRSYQGGRPKLRAVGTPQQLRDVYGIFGTDIISFSVRPYNSGESR